MDVRIQQAMIWSFGAAARKALAAFTFMTATPGLFFNLARQLDN
jgi:hypothetical protein